MMSAFGRYEPFHKAVVEAWCLDENSRYHSALVWWALHDVKPFVLRENTNKCPFGVMLPNVRQLCGCSSDNPGSWRIKEWSKKVSSCRTGSVIRAVGSCCKYSLYLTLLEPPPRTHTFRGIGYVLDTWPGIGEFSSEGRKAAKGKGSEDSQEEVGPRVSKSRSQKRPRASDVGPGPSKRREGEVNTVSDDA